MPTPIVRALGILKGAAATVNMKFGLGISPSLSLSLCIHVWLADSMI